jgi:dihydrofolate reductase
VARIVATQHVALDGLIEATGTKQFVVSSSLNNPNSNYAAMLDGDPVEEVARLRSAEAGRDVVVHGSARLVQTLLEHDLLDELRLMVHPIVLGTGERAFGEAIDKTHLRLKATDAVGDGITILVYEAAA